MGLDDLIFLHPPQKKTNCLVVCIFSPSFGCFFPILTQQGSVGIDPTKRGGIFWKEGNEPQQSGGNPKRLALAFMHLFV